MFRMVVSCRRDDGAPHPDRMINYSKHGARYLRYLLHDGQALSYENCKYLEHSVPKTSSECRLPSRALFSIALPRSATTVAWPSSGKTTRRPNIALCAFLYLRMLHHAEYISTRDQVLLKHKENRVGHLGPGQMAGLIGIVSFDSHKVGFPVL